MVHFGDWAHCQKMFSLNTFDEKIAWYRKDPKISDTRKFAVITLKVEQDGFSLE